MIPANICWPPASSFVCNGVLPAWGLANCSKPPRCLKGRFITTFARKKPSASPCLSDITPAIISVLRRTSPPVGNHRDRLLAWYQETLKQFCQQGAISGCLTVKLSAEVCDLSEDMRSTMDKGAQEIMALLARALEDGRNSHCLHFTGQPLPQAQVLMPCGWAPICRPKYPVAPRRWKMRWRMLRPSLQRLSSNGRFYFLYYKTTGLLISGATMSSAKLFTPSRWVPSRRQIAYLWRL